MPHSFQDNTISVWHSSKRSDGNYGSNEYGASLTVPIPTDIVTTEQRMEFADNLEGEVFAIVEAQFAPTPANVVPMNPGAVATAQAPQAAAPATAPAPAAVPQPVAETFPGAVAVVPANPAEWTGAQDEWPRARVAYLEANDPETLRNEWWDNRPKKQSGDYSPKAPDFKLKADSNVVVWPPKS